MTSGLFRSLYIYIDFDLDLEIWPWPTLWTKMNKQSTVHDCAVTKAKINPPYSTRIYSWSILFLLFISDLPNASLFKTLLKADDALLLMKGERLDDLYDWVNHKFYKINCYRHLPILRHHFYQKQFVSQIWMGRPPLKKIGGIPKYGGYAMVKPFFYT